MLSSNIFPKLVLEDVQDSVNRIINKILIVLLELNGIKIKKTGNFINLDSIIDQNGFSDMEIMKRVLTERKVLGILKYILWSRNFIGKIERMIYHSILEMLLWTETYTRQKTKTFQLFECI